MTTYFASKLKKCSHKRMFQLVGGPPTNSTQLRRYADGKNLSYAQGLNCMHIRVIRGLCRWHASSVELLSSTSQTCRLFFLQKFSYENVSPAHLRNKMACDCST